MSVKGRKQHNAYGNWKYKYCSEIFRTRAELRAHNTLHKNDPNYGYSGWNSGLHLSDDTKQKISEAGKNKVVSEETKKKISETCKKNKLSGGLRAGSGRGKKGWYKGFYCRSTWELAWLIYEIEVNSSKVEACYESFDYELDEKKHKYYPDFKIGDTYFEIKGWHRPDVDAKMQQFPKSKKYILIEGKQQIAKYLNYAKEKYGNDLTVLYEKQDLRGADESKFH